MRKTKGITFALLLLPCLFCSVFGQVYTDNFDRSDSNSLGASWVEIEVSTNVFVIAGNEIRPRASSTGNLRGIAHYNAIAPSDQFSQAVFKGKTVGLITFHGPAVRIDPASTTSNATCYGVVVDDGATPDLRLYKWVGADMTLAAGNILATVGVTVIVDDIVRIEARGSNVRVLINGLEQISVTDAAIGSGRVGFAAPLVAGFTTQADWDDWQGGGLSIDRFWLARHPNHPAHSTHGRTP